ncbi:MAG: hypothetical protein AAF412_06375 [Pseudomonadota bacterium]
MTQKSEVQFPKPQARQADEQAIQSGGEAQLRVCFSPWIVFSSSIGPMSGFLGLALIAQGRTLSILREGCPDRRLERQMRKAADVGLAADC